MLQRTEGIVLRTVPFSEADLIVTYITPDLGPLKLFAKSPRKFKSRFGSSLEPLTHSQIAFWGKENTSLPRLTQSDIIHSFQSIRDSLYFFLKVSEIIELTLSFVPERDVNKKVYFLLFNTLQFIEHIISEDLHIQSRETKKSIEHMRGKGAYLRTNLLFHHYKVRFLEHVGFAPRLDACGRCGNKGNFFYISHGSILCKNCSRGVDSPFRLSPATIKLYHDLHTWDTGKVHRIKPSDILLSELTEIMDMHIRYILDKPLKSGEFIHSLHVR